MSWRSLSPLTVVLGGLLVFLLIEFRLNFLERGMGAYLDYHNPERPRLAKFVQQETRNIEARQKLETLLDQRAHRAEPREPAPAAVAPSEFVELEGGQKLVMTRARFLDAYQKLEQTPRALPPSSEWDAALRHDRWGKTILTRGGWFRKNRLFFVDDQNKVLSEVSLSTEQFALLRAYGAADLSQIDRPHIQVYPPQTFFAALRTLPEPIRDQAMNRETLSDVEDRAIRVGVSDASADGLIQVIVETFGDDQLDYTSITLSEETMQALLQALGGVSR
ncbi:MAG: hypothetical protein HY710_06960 [Candidatus Latescibacteria bacterium]|nr:hypothetical protein [Candidatus Latescibacterota bacterium]